MVQALLCQTSPDAPCKGSCAGEGGHLLVAPSISIMLNFYFRVEILKHTLSFPITPCTTWHNKASVVSLQELL